MGELYNRGHVDTVDKLSTYIQTAQESKLPLYRSYYAFDETALTIGDLKNYQGTYTLPQIIFDIDKEDRSDEAILELARAFCEQLISEFGLRVDQVCPTFSGVGYHIHIPELFDFKTATTLPQEVKKVMNHFFPVADNIFDSRRIIRVEGTLNPKSGLYKIPLTWEQLENMTHVEVMELAKTMPAPLPLLFSKELCDNKLRERVREVGVELSAVKKKEVSHDTSNIVTCMQKLYDTKDQPGTRHARILRMASAWRRAGLPQDAVQKLIHGWAPTLPIDELQRTVSDVYTKGYAYSCHDAIMMEYCDSKCIYFKGKNFTPAVLAPEEMENQYANFINTDYGSTSINLGSLYKGIGSYTINPGEFVVVMGDTGLNKTAWVQNLVVRLPHLRTLFLSLEVNANLIYRRFIQIAHNMSKEEVISHYRANNKELAKKIEHIRVITLAPNIDDLERLIGVVTPHVLVVDTTDCVRVPGAADPLDELGHRFTQMANKSNIIIIGVHHISKAAAFDYRTGTSRPLNVHSGKGASTIEQKSDHAIGIEGVATGTFRTLRTLKARDEGSFVLQCKVDMKTFRFSQA